MSEALAVGWPDPLPDPLPDPADPLSPDAPLDTPTPRPTAVQRLHDTTRPVTPVQRLKARSRSYRAALPRAAKGLHDTTHSDVLTRAAAAQETVTAGQVAVLQACVDWASLHGEATHGNVTEGGEQLVALAGDGAPLVAEFAIPELALRLGVSTDTGRYLMTDALELAHRLPHCWSALLAGGIPVHKARRVARATRDLPADAATYVDTCVAPYLHAIGTTALDETIEKAIWRYDLPRALAESAAALDRRGFTIDLDTPLNPVNADALTGSAAVVQAFGHLDRADALELERAIADLAHHQLHAGSTDTLEVRRAKALGMLARRETPIPIPDLSPDAQAQRAQREEWDDLDNTTGHETPATEQPATEQPATEQPAVISRRRDLVIHVHLSLDALQTGTGMARLEGCPRPITVDQVRDWLQAPGTTTRLTVRPVLDLDTHLETPGYTPSADLAEQTVLRDRTCVFPHCTRDARTTDLDHVIPHADDHTGGPTTSDNIAALCRRHHRLKTHHPGWTYRVLHPGTYLWTTPHGQTILRDPHGTHAL